MGAHLSEDDRDRAMLVLALNGGHSVRAHEQLASEGVKISARQLRYYRDEPRYLEIRKTKAAEIERGMVEQYKDATRLSIELGTEATSVALEALRAGEIKGVDAAKVSQQAMVAAAVATDKTLLLEGRPTQITESRSIEAAIAAMARTLGFDAESTAVEDLPSVPLIPESAEANAREIDAS
jgi:hypothetical protein